MILLFLEIVGAAALVGAAGWGISRVAASRAGSARVEAELAAARALRLVLEERDARTRLALVLEAAGLRRDEREDGHIVARAPVLAPLSDLLDRLPSGRPFPPEGVWVSHGGMEALLEELPAHPGDVLDGLVRASGRMPFEATAAERSVLSALERADPWFAPRLHVPLALVETRRLGRARAALGRAGHPSDPAAERASVTVGDWVRTLARRSGRG